MLVVDKPKFKMAIYDSKKEVHVQIIGFIKEHLVEEYLKDLQDTVSKVAKRDYILVVDATYQSPLPRKLAAGIGETMMIYTTFGFKDVILVMPKSKISFVQARNGLETVKFPGKIVENSAMLAAHKY